MRESKLMFLAGQSSIPGTERYGHRKGKEVLKVEAPFIDQISGLGKIKNVAVGYI